MNSTELTTAEKLDKLPWSIASNGMMNIFWQLFFSGAVFTLFLDALGLNKSQIGFLLSLLPYTGLLALFVAPLIAHVGYKRVYVTADAVRTTMAGFLIFAPWVAANFGLTVALSYITIVVTLFSVARTIMNTAYYPWVQEYVPNLIQGKYSATNSLVTALVGFLAVTTAGFIIDLFTGLNGFMILMGIGLLFGFGSVWAAAHVPGGGPNLSVTGMGTALQDTLAAFRDKRLVFFLSGLGLITLASTPLISFVPLFMQEKVGLSSGNVVLVQTGMLLGGLVSTYLWGWAADRYGSRPVMLSGICLHILLPLFWMLMPRSTPLSLYIGLGISFLHGITDMGWVIGSTRLLYVSIVPAERRSEYMALYYACAGVFGGTSQLLAGLMVQASSGLSGQFLIFTLDAYTLLFTVTIILAIISLLFLRRVRTDSEVTVEEFAGLFLHGNPFQAMTSLVGYHFARDESALVAITERLGQTRSPLNVEELLQVLADPRFNVRFEAIISIARTRPHPRLTQALIDVFNGTELALSNIAAWALGRSGDKTAIPALRAGLDSDFYSVRASSARALGRLGDTSISPLLRERLPHETDKGLQMAYASALGNLVATEAVVELLMVLAITQNEGARRELALSLARLGGDEGHFIQLMREAGTDIGTTTSRTVSVFKKKVNKTGKTDPHLLALLESAADALARNNLPVGAAHLAQVIALLPAEAYEPHSLTILQESAKHLEPFTAEQTEYLLLVLHTLEVGWNVKR